MADGTRAPPGAASAFAAYLALWVGYLAIGQATQQRDIIAGLWVTEILAIALPAVLAIRLAALPARPFLGLRAPRPAHLAAAILLAVANQPVVSFVTWASRALSPEPWVREFDSLQRALDLFFSQQALPMVITVAVAAPLGEELFFRGYAVPAFARSWGPLAACIATGAMFSLLHGNKIGFAGLWEIGVLLAVLRLWSGSLWPSILCHATNNGVAGAAFLLGWEDPDIPPPAWLLALGAVLLAAGIALVPRALRRAAPTQPEAPPVDAGSGFSNALALEAIWVAGVVLGIAQFRHLMPDMPMVVWLGLSAAAVV
ncbi:MAG: CPBP family intramembrane glutamic endopeptidase, partial [Myxococcales bacterium]